MKHRSWTVALCAVAGGLLLVPNQGCNAFDENKLAAGNQAIGCTDGSRSVPPRPASADQSDMGGDVPDFWLALKDVGLNQTENEEWAQTGFNLDDRCTSAAEGNFECLPIRDGSPFPTDGVQGIDNTFGSTLFPQLDLAFQGLDELSIEAENKGIGCLMARIRGWNGTANDPEVQVVVSQSVFGTPGVGGVAPAVDIVNYEGFNPSTMAQLPFPNWDGNDFFWIRSDSFVNPNAADIDAANPTLTDLEAYVADGTLVMTIPDGTEVILVGEGLATQVRLSDVDMALDLLTAFNAPRTEGHTVTIGGRWGYNDLLRTAETVGVCPDDMLFNLLNNQLRAMTDVMLDPPSPGETLPPDTRCDAVSLGITFQAYFADVGGITEGQPLPTPCDDPPDMGVPDMGMPDMGP